MPANKTMRITGGLLVRRKFLVPPEVDDNLVRPTPDRVREAVFSIIKPNILDAYVLDIFAGSGAHGFEAISRGARFVRFIEKNPSIAQIIKTSLTNLGINTQSEIIITDAMRYISQTPTHLADIIFLDPPYPVDLTRDFFSSLTSHLKPAGLVIYRCHKTKSPNLSPDWQIIRDKTYGSTRVFILTLESGIS